MSLPLEIDTASVKAMIDSGESFTLLDVREPNEHETVAIAQARLLPMSELGQRVGEIESLKAERIVVHCHHGVRSLRVTNWLRDQGFEKVQSMAGGIHQWAVEIEPGMATY